MDEFWDQRYNVDEYVYGVKPNIFYSQCLEKLVPGKILFIGEGEGRNAIFAAKKKWEVDAIDFSETAKEKALKLAKENNLKINYATTDVLHYNYPLNYYDAVVVIYIHLNQESREILHRKVIETLKPGGYVIMEVYEKEQINRNSGGPRDVNMLYSLEEIFEDFQDFEIHKFSKETITLNEGSLHQGPAEVIRLFAAK